MNEKRNTGISFAANQLIQTDDVQKNKQVPFNSSEIPQLSQWRFCDVVGHAGTVRHSRHTATSVKLAKQPLTRALPARLMYNILPPQGKAHLGNLAYKTKQNSDQRQAWKTPTCLWLQS